MAGALLSAFMKLRKQQANFCIFASCTFFLQWGNRGCNSGSPQEPLTGKELEHDVLFFNFKGNVLLKSSFIWHKCFCHAYTCMSSLIIGNIREILEEHLRDYIQRRGWETSKREEKLAIKQEMDVSSRYRVRQSDSFNIRQDRTQGGKQGTKKGVFYRWREHHVGDTVNSNIHTSNRVASKYVKQEPIELWTNYVAASVSADFNAQRVIGQKTLSLGDLLNMVTKSKWM